MHAVCCPVTTTPTSHCTTMQDGVWKPTATVSRPNCCCCMSNGLWQKIPILSLCVYVRALHPTPPTGFTPTALHVSVRLCVCVRRPFRLQGNVRGEAVVLNLMRKEYISHRVTRSDCSALRFTRHASHVDMCDSILRTHAWNEATRGPQHWRERQWWTKGQTWVEIEREKASPCSYCPSFKSNVHSASSSLSQRLLTALSLWFLPAHVQSFRPSFTTLTIFPPLPRLFSYGSTLAALSSSLCSFNLHSLA